MASLPAEYERLKAHAAANAISNDRFDGAAMKNQNGVVLKMHATSQGVDFLLPVDGVALKITE